MAKVELQRDLDLALQELKLTKKRHTQENETFEAEIRELRTTNASLSLTLQETAARRDEVEGRLGALEEELTAERSAHKAVKREVEALSGRFAEMREQNHQLALEAIRSTMHATAHRDSVSRRAGWGHVERAGRTGAES